MKESTRSALTTMESLQKVEEFLDTRIALLSDINSRCKKVVKHLRACQSHILCPTVVDSESCHVDSTEDISEHSNKEDNNDTTKLEEILSLARKIRESKKSVKSGTAGGAMTGRLASDPKLRSGITTSAATKSPRLLPESRLSAESDTTTVENYAESSTICAHNRVSLRENLFSQLDLISKRRFVVSSPAFITNELYSSQTKLLTRLSGKPKVPRSFIYETARSKMGSSSRKNNNNISSSRKKLDDVAALTHSIRNLRSEYEKHMKGPIARRSLAKCDRDQVLKVYCRLHSLYDKYEQSTVQNEAEEAAECPANNQTSLLAADEPFPSSIDELVSVFPLCTPVDGIPKMGSPETQQQLLRQWYDESRLRVSSYHLSLLNTIKIYSEREIATQGLRVTLRQLKECCEGSSASGNRYGHGERETSASMQHSSSSQKWVFALKQYRGMRNCLVDETRGWSQLMFTNNFEQHNLSS